MGGISGFLMNFPPFIYFLLSLLEKLPVKLPVPVEKMVCRVSYARTGRHSQRYDNRGFRLVVGCIPYRYRKTEEATSIDEMIEVLVISAQNGKGMLFPKGGWEKDESMEAAAIRETLEEAGVLGNIEGKLGKWCYKSKRQSIFHEGHMFSLLVKQELDRWPEKNIRERKWVTVSKAKEECPHLWMREALEELVRRQMQQEEANRIAGSKQNSLQLQHFPATMIGCFLEFVRLKWCISVNDEKSGFKLGREQEMLKLISSHLGLFRVLVPPFGILSLVRQVEEELILRNRPERVKFLGLENIICTKVNSFSM